MLATFRKYVIMSLHNILSFVALSISLPSIFAFMIYYCGVGYPFCQSLQIRYTLFLSWFACLQYSLCMLNSLRLLSSLLLLNFQLSLQPQYCTKKSLRKQWKPWRNYRILWKITWTKTSIRQILWFFYMHTTIIERRIQKALVIFDISRKAEVAALCWIAYVLKLVCGWELRCNYHYPPPPKHLKVGEDLKPIIIIIIFHFLLSPWRQLHDWKPSIISCAFHNVKTPSNILEFG